VSIVGYLVGAFALLQVKNIVLALVDADRLNFRPRPTACSHFGKLPKKKLAKYFARINVDIICFTLNWGLLQVHQLCGLRFLENFWQIISILKLKI